MSWTGDDFHIKDTNGMLVFRALGKVMSMSGRTEISDAQGNHLFAIRKELFSIPRSFYAEAPNGDRFLNVDGKWSCKYHTNLYRYFEISLMTDFAIVGSSKSDISFVNVQTGQRVVLKLKGDFFDMSAEIRLDDMVVARIDRKLWSAKDVFMNAQTYFLTVAPGMDMACAVAACICLDERRNQR